MRRPAFLILSAAALLLSLPATGPLRPASAQTTQAPVETTPSGPASAPPPLMTAPRPEDQSTTDPTASRSGVSGSAPSDEMQRPAAPAGTSSPPVAALPPDVLTTAEARTLIGQTVRTRDGQSGGKITNFLLNPQNGTVEQVLLQAEGRTEPVAVPAAALKTGAGQPTLDLGSADLAKAPAAPVAGSADRMLVPTQQ